MKTAYLTGYTGKPTRTPAQLLQLAINLGAVVVDSRYNPQSRVKHWNRYMLHEVLGDRYKHVKAFGNEAYKEGYIRLSDPAAGLVILESQNVECCIILCACSDGAHCHRTQVGDFLNAHGWTVREVTQQEWEDARP